MASDGEEPDRTLEIIKEVERPPEPQIKKVAIKNEPLNDNKPPEELDPFFEDTPAKVKFIPPHEQEHRQIAGDVRHNVAKHKRRVIYAKRKNSTFRPAPNFARSSGVVRSLRHSMHKSDDDKGLMSIMAGDSTTLILGGVALVLGASLFLRQ